MQSVSYPISKRQILDSSKLKEFADDNFKFNENGWLQASSPFPTVFSKDLYCRHVKTKACLGKGESPLIASFQLWCTASLNLKQSQNGVLGNGLKMCRLF